jgi:hypothetical protein
MKKMRAGMIAHRRVSCLRIDARDHCFAFLHRADDFRSVDAFAGSAGISGFDDSYGLACFLGKKHTRVADLAAGFGVKRGFVERDFARLSAP